MESADLAIIAVFVIAYALVSGRLSRTVITGPMVFVAFGLLVGSEGLDVVDLSLENTIVETFAEITLIIVLFSDAARIDLGILRRNAAVPARLLGIGMPLTIAGGLAAAVVLFDGLNLWEAALVAAVLAPTDAALGQAVVTSGRVPARIRQALNVESGLNDGMAVPFVSIFIAGAAAAGGLGTAGFWTEFAAKQIGFGLLVGAGVGIVAGLLIQYATTTGWMNHAFQQLAVLAVPLLGFAVAEQIDGNGFIAAFVAGIAIGNVTRRISHGLFEVVEDGGQLLVLLTFMIFGAAFVGPALGDLTWQIALYAVLSLTVVRMLPVAISMIGMGFQPDTVAFLGWFGPRGLASIVFGLVVLESSVAERGEIFVIVTWTVLLSVVVHGLSARPSVDWYGAKAEEMADEPDMPEMETVEELPTRSMS